MFITAIWLNVDCEVWQVSSILWIILPVVSSYLMLIDYLLHHPSMVFEPNFLLFIVLVCEKTEQLADDKMTSSVEVMGSGACSLRCSAQFATEQLFCFCNSILPPPHLKVTDVQADASGRCEGMSAPDLKSALMNWSCLFVPQSAAAVHRSGRGGTNKPPNLDLLIGSRSHHGARVHSWVEATGSSRMSWFACNLPSAGSLFTTWHKTALLFPVPRCSPDSLPVFSSYFDLITANEFVCPYCSPELWRVVSCQREGRGKGTFWQFPINLPGSDWCLSPPLSPCLSCSLWLCIVWPLLFVYSIIW